MTVTVYRNYKVYRKTKHLLEKQSHIPPTFRKICPKQWMYSGLLVTTWYKNMCANSTIYRLLSSLVDRWIDISSDLSPCYKNSLDSICKVNRQVTQFWDWLGFIFALKLIFAIVMCWLSKRQSMHFYDMLVL